MTVAELAKTHTQAVFHHILVATDFSDSSQRAFRDALALAAHDDARVYLVHALPLNMQYLSLEAPPELDLERIDAEKEMKDFVGDLDSGHKVEAVFLLRGGVEEIVKSLVGDKQIDLLVIGTRGRGGISKLALGSVAEELLRVAPCPVLTIGPKAEVASRNAGEFRRILFATDFGKAAAKALPLALSLAQAHQAKLTLLHLLPAMPASTASLSAFSPPGPAADELLEWETAAQKLSVRKLKECLPEGMTLAHEPECVVGTDFLPEGILEAAAKRQVDLIVMGANRALAPRAAAHFPWALVHDVVRDAPCPVLTVTA